MSKDATQFLWRYVYHNNTDKPEEGEDDTVALAKAAGYKMYAYNNVVYWTLTQVPTGITIDNDGNFN